jgi:hypothetical protein
VHGSIMTGCVSQDCAWVHHERQNVQRVMHCLAPRRAPRLPTSRLSCASSHKPAAAGLPLAFPTCLPLPRSHTWGDRGGWPVVRLYGKAAGNCMRANIARAHACAVFSSTSRTASSAASLAAARATSRAAFRTVSRADCCSDGAAAASTGFSATAREGGVRCGGGSVAPPDSNQIRIACADESARQRGKS